MLGARNELTVEFVRDGSLAPELARCVAREFVQVPGMLALLSAIGNNAPTSEQTELLRNAVAGGRVACDNDLDAGLP